ncbi:hypothetical protein CAPTEDRAFT_99638 [Capitella teleta]|uniref:Hexosyltransferase n=1 Tax=Capitella teleta TaxID=283909 RepID=R7TS10_CAPTE|nr:hypothetical protein CAPTEDRAFT_99638 [Capitella teleta]|eukprot:ELT93795.1 hypothetical protein CAPTEDRAFT_99638 [Capitella teleta]
MRLLHYTTLAIVTAFPDLWWFRQTSTLVILVHSSPGNKERRDVIRSTWLSTPSPEVTSFFVIGTKHLSNVEKGRLHDENYKTGDLLLLENVEDAYKTLTSKTLQSFVWIHHHMNFRFVLKCDDDSFVQIPLLLTKAREFNATDSVYWGNFNGMSKGLPDPPPFILCDRFIPFARGGGYVLSADLVTYITANQHHLFTHRAEDVAVAVWLTPLKVHRLHDVDFDTEYMSVGCLNSFIVTHKQNIYMMEEKHKNLQKHGRLCQSERLYHKRHTFDWKAYPSKCCPPIEH